MKKKGLEGRGQGNFEGKGVEDHGSLGQRKKICPRFKSKELLQIKPTGKSGNKPEKFLKSKSCKNQGVTNLPPLEKSRPRDLVAQGTNMNILT